MFKLFLLPVDEKNTLHFGLVSACARDGAVLLPGRSLAIPLPAEGRNLARDWPVGCLHFFPGAVYRVSYAYEGEEETALVPDYGCGGACERRGASPSGTPRQSPVRRLPDTGAGRITAAHRENNIRRLLVRNYSYSRPTPGVVFNHHGAPVPRRKPHHQSMFPPSPPASLPKPVRNPS